MKRIFSYPAWSLVLSVLMAAVAGQVMAAPAKSQSKPRAQGGISASAGPKTMLDTATIRKLYMDGEFDQAIDILEAGMKEKLPFDHRDSVFIFKHLGVMYAAKYETREKGKYYMHQLLMTEPTAKIMDMYASDMIYMIFKNIQDEFESNRMRLEHAETLVAGNSRPEPAPEKPAKESGSKKSNHALLWVGATGVVVAAGVGAFILFSEKPATNTTDHPVE